MSLDSLKTGRMEDSFSIPEGLVDKDKTGVQSKNSEFVCVSVWDQATGKFVNRISPKCTFDTLG